MEETKQDGQDSTSVEPEVIYSPAGYECTIMTSPITGNALVIRECFDRWQLEHDNETEEEHKMRKTLLNKFKKQSLKRGRRIG